MGVSAQKGTGAGDHVLKSDWLALSAIGNPMQQLCRMTTANQIVANALHRHIW